MKKSWMSSARHWITSADDAFSISIHSPLFSVQKSLVSSNQGTVVIILSMDMEKWLMFSTVSNIYLHGPHHIHTVALSFNPCYSKCGLRTNQMDVSWKLVRYADSWATSQACITQICWQQDPQVIPVHFEV